MPAPGYRGFLEMKHVRSVYMWLVGLIFFGIFSIIVLLLTFLIHARKLDPLIRRLLKYLFKLMLIKVEVEGSEKLDKTRTYLIMSNHVNIFDVPLLKAFIPVYFRGVEADYSFNWPIYGWLIKRLGTIPIKRESIYSSKRSLRKAKKLLEHGTSIVILPEGHRTRTGRMQPFKKMPFMLAKDTTVDLVPIGMSGLFTLKRKGSWHLNATTIKIKFGDVISSEKIKDMKFEELRDEMYKRIAALVERE
jgi:1-acyl-sn-glycerol-3-phosphate acyltransferase